MWLISGSISAVLPSARPSTALHCDDINLLLLLLLPMGGLVVRVKKEKKKKKKKKVFASRETRTGSGRLGTAC